MKLAKFISRPVVLCALTAGAALVVYLLTWQTGINSGGSPYTTDVGEIQNALPRWGTIHDTGYPVYTFLGSLIVSVLRQVGIEPAAGSSIVSALWGAVTVGLLAALALELGLSRWTAAGSALIGGLTLSFWINSSLAEVHTMTMALTAASLLYALRFRRSANRADLLWLAVWLSQGVVHQRAVILLVIPVALLILPHQRMVIKNWLPMVGIGILAVATYLYLSIRTWMGTDWLYGQAGTWDGFWSIVLDTKVTRVVQLPADAGGWLSRMRGSLQLILDDLPWPLLALGTAGIWLNKRLKLTMRLALTLTMLLYYGISLIVWEGTVSDALLAVKLPVALAGALGIGMLFDAAGRRWRAGRFSGALVIAGSLVWLALTNAPRVLALTRDNTIEAVIAQVSGADYDPDARAAVLIPWGHDYWALRYAQSYRGVLQGIPIVDHNASPGDYIVGGYFYTPAKTFYVLPLAWWQERLGAVSLDSAGPGIIRIAASGSPTDSLPQGSQSVDLGNGVRILETRLQGTTGGRRILTVYWQRNGVIGRDYAVAVKMTGTAADGAQGVVFQADRPHPVDGFYPTMLWQAGEVVRDDYLLEAPDGSDISYIDLSMYVQEDDGSFRNTAAVQIKW